MTAETIGIIFILIVGVIVGTVFGIIAIISLKELLSKN